MVVKQLVDISSLFGLRPVIPVRQLGFVVISLFLFGLIMLVKQFLLIDLLLLLCVESSSVDEMTSGAVSIDEDPSKYLWRSLRSFEMSFRLFMISSLN